MKNFGPPEHVYVEQNWYDGPRAGIADVHGLPHRFESIFDESQDDYSNIVLLAPIDAATLALEVEQFQIFLDWREKFDAGLVTTDTHPTHRNMSRRFDELEAILRPGRVIDPRAAKRAYIKLEWIDKQKRYHRQGINYQLCWCLIDGGAS